MTAAITAPAVAACDAPHQPPVIVGQRDAESVDLELGHVVHGGISEAGPFTHPFVERAQLHLVIGVVETEHRRKVPDCRKGGGGCASHALGRGVLRDEVGMLGLEALELVEQAVECLIRDLGGIEDVVAVLVMADRVA